MSYGAIAGALISSAASYWGGKEQNRANARIARDQMAFQDNMSSTSYQRAVKDMEAAGINPMMASQLGGASTPPGASAHMVDTVTPAVSSAQQAYRMKAEVDNLVKQNDNIKADTQAKHDLAKLYKEQAKSTNVNSALAAYQLPEARNSAYIADSVAGKFLTGAQRVGSILGNVGSGIASAASAFRGGNRLMGASFYRYLNRNRRNNDAYNRSIRR